MALFFDADWFDGRRESLGLSRATIASALGMTQDELAEVWKDQRELTARHVAVLAALLGVGAEELARHAGVSTPVPASEATLAEIAERLRRIEDALARLTELVARRA